jgi:Zn-finger nucleic acid-binding protein
MNCPYCLTEMSSYKKENNTVELFKCKSCGGTAIHKFKLEEIISETILNKLFNATPSRINTLECPSCSYKMHESVLKPDSLSLRLDICSSCSLIWFDTSEFTTISSQFTENNNNYKEQAKNLITEFKSSQAIVYESNQKQIKTANAIFGFLQGVIFGPHRRW